MGAEWIFRGRSMGVERIFRELPELPLLPTMTLRECRRRNVLYARARARWRRRVPVLPVNAIRELSVEELKRRGGDG